MRRLGAGKHAAETEEQVEIYEGSKRGDEEGDLKEEREGVPRPSALAPPRAAAAARWTLAMATARGGPVRGAQRREVESPLPSLTQATRRVLLRLFDPYRYVAFDSEFYF